MISFAYGLSQLYHNIKYGISCLNKNGIISCHLRQAYHTYSSILNIDFNNACLSACLVIHDMVWHHSRQPYHNYPATDLEFVCLVDNILLTLQLNIHARACCHGWQVYCTRCPKSHRGVANLNFVFDYLTFCRLYTWFQQDVTTAHTTREIMQFLRKCSKENNLPLQQCQLAIAFPKLD